MEDAVKRTAEALLQAIQAENYGRHFYLMAARTTEDPKGRQMFEAFADEERDHFEFLKAHYKSILKTGRLDENAKLGSPKDTSSAIFSERIHGRIKDAHFEITALSVAIELELSAVRFYRNQAETSQDGQVKDFYSELADWESLHYQALADQLTELKQDYWTANDFAPF